MVALDPATQSNYAQITTKHVHFDWTIDWKKRIISGSATHDLEANQDNVAHIVYDSGPITRFRSYTDPFIPTLQA